MCLPGNLDMSDIYLETPSAYAINLNDKEIDSKVLKVTLFILSIKVFFHTIIEH